MKFIAALIATAAAVRDEDMQMTGDFDMPAVDLPALSMAAQEIADIEDFTAGDLALLAELPHEDLIALGMYCMWDEDACADNFDEIVSDACWGEGEAAAGCEVLGGMYEEVAARFETMFPGSGSGSGSETEGSGSGSETEGSGSGSETEGSGSGSETEGCGSGSETEGSGSGSETEGSGSGSESWSDVGTSDW